MSPPSFVLLLFTGVVVANAASITLLITGNSIHNVFKQKLAGQLIDDFHRFEHGFNADIVVLNNGRQKGFAEDVFGMTQTLTDVPLRSNISTLVLTTLGVDEMSLEQLMHLETFTRTERGLLVVELGIPTIQVQALLDKGALCWGVARLAIESPNTAYLCNDLEASRLSNLQLDELRGMTDSAGKDWLKVPEQPRPFWPCLFASAAKAEKKNRRQQVEENIELDEDDEVEEIVERVLQKDNSKKDEDEPSDGMSGRRKREFCKYRKSCYETGKKFEPEPYEFSIAGLWDSSSSEKKPKLSKTEDADQDGIPDTEDDAVHLSDRKLSCKYRTSCYQQHDIPLSDKVREREEKRSFMSSKLQVPTGKKRTLKDIAERTLVNVEKNKEKAKSRPLSNSMIVEKKLKFIENELNKKLACKYRKSCLETGVLPEIEASQWDFSIPYVPTIFEKQDQAEEKKFEELESVDKKVFCKYRKSCYDSGEKPVIEAEIRTSSFADFLETAEQVETRKIPLKERCKYRKSCYETGILPDLTKSDDDEIAKIVQKEANGIVPSSVQGLKNLCKYRKSCYQEVAASESTEIVHTIRKRRLVEREVRKRHTRRYRKRRRDVSIAIAADGYYRKQTLKEKLEAKNGQKQQVPQEKKKVVKSKAAGKAKGVDVKDVVEEPKQEMTTAKPVEEEPPKKKSKKTEEQKENEPPAETTRSKKQKKNKNDEDAVDPVVVPILVEIPVAKKSKKSENEPKKEEREAEKIESRPQESKNEATPKAKQVKEKADPKSKAQAKKTATPPPATPNKETEDDDDDVKEEEPRKHNKVYCKYRKSCYNTGNRVDTAAAEFALNSLWSSPSSSHGTRRGPRDVDTDGDGIPDFEDKDLSEPLRKLGCKYRKSCYESGFLPEIRHGVEAPSSLADTIKASTKVGKMLQCKYRKSCYREMGINDNADSDDIVEVEEKRKQLNKATGVIPETESHEQTHQHHKKQQNRKDKEKEKKKKAVEEDFDDEDDDKRRKEEPKKVKEVTKADAAAEVQQPLELATKHDCKYRKSCYSSVEPRATKEDHSGNMARKVVPTTRENCNIYYHSCREKLGLPLKEKAPIGPNGKRLCRKQPVQP